MALYCLSTDPFNSHELDSMVDVFPSSQRPIHFAMRASVRYQKETRDKSAVALSAHFIGLFVQERMGEIFELWAMVHISQIRMIAHTENEYVLVETPETKITFSGQGTTKFAQLLYRNYCISYSLNDPEDVVEVQSDNLRLFPDIRLRVSPSQRFQFAYFATCSLNSVKYNQDVVRYIHSLLLSGNSIVDVSLLPLNLFGHSDSLLPIFTSLKLLRYISGVCLSNTERPTVLQDFVPIVSYCDNMRIIHFENCGVTDGLTELAREVHKSGNFSVSYWNLSKNRFTDFSAFPAILNRSVEPLLYINLNDCGISAEDGADLFRVLEQNEMCSSLKYFYYSGNDMGNVEILSEFSRFLKVARLETLDLSRTSEGAEGILKCINVNHVCLKTLILSESVYSREAISQLLIFLKETNTLRYLDISSMNLPPESVAGIIHTIVKNRELKDFHLIMDRLDLHGDNLLPIFRAFLDEEKLSKWKELSFNGNGLQYEDLKNLIPMLKRMRKLESISLSDNFHSDMYGIGVLLKELLQIPAIKNVSLAGGENNHLEQELLPFLRVAAKHTGLVHLDVSQNAMGGQIIPCLVQILHDCHKLEVLLIDGNDINETDKIETLVDAVASSKNLISFSFPVTDSTKMVSAVDDEDVKSVLVDRLAELQVSAAKAVTEHRMKMGLPGELPFDAKPEIMDLIKSISSATRKRMAYNHEHLKIHSCVCEIFGLPLPFQKSGEVVTDGGPVEEIDIGDMAIYETESMARIVKEVNPRYPDFYNTATIGPNLRTLLARQPPPKFEKRSSYRPDSSSSDDINLKHSKKRRDIYSSRSESSSSDDVNLKHSKKRRDMYAIRSDDDFRRNTKRSRAQRDFHKNKLEHESDDEFLRMKSRKSDRSHAIWNDSTRGKRHEGYVKKKSAKFDASSSEFESDQPVKRRKLQRSRKFAKSGPRIKFDMDYAALPFPRNPKNLETRGIVGEDDIDRLMQTGYLTMTERNNLLEQLKNKRSAAPILRSRRHKQPQNKYDAAISSDSSDFDRYESQEVAVPKPLPRPQERPEVPSLDLSPRDFDTYDYSSDDVNPSENEVRPAPRRVPPRRLSWISEPNQASVSGRLGSSSSGSEQHSSDQDVGILANPQRLPGHGSSNDGIQELRDMFVLSSDVDDIGLFGKDRGNDPALSLFSSSSTTDQEPPPKLDNNSDVEDPLPTLYSDSDPEEPPPKFDSDPEEPQNPYVPPENPPQKIDSDTEEPPQELYVAPRKPPKRDVAKEKPPKRANKPVRRIRQLEPEPEPEPIQAPSQRNRYALSSLPKPPHLASKQAIIEYAHDMLLADGIRC